ncbi:hypothetical protein CO058_02430 [candidate division WWE3 bacterium CG_4_9_14_0_2_um_filter_35_11]|uniref:PIN domain-containing protein n=1 Tax=candidate division WWE3 bacterium CG_4_9_14_0_2_um_filter_35_11 TaxID=1975077 RepID=A0A2M8ELI5_UNCKA|nr:MAG: hypothetical protein COV25_02690 [candidate division WWE3 bacterium CG10_big_fil_rev_8_21_14_0_10_35_32]PJC23591.1 MAG: hypothetical protein CO058_02430 [candidate division WWE3 bacterium CG_4_9_14_0_2_um_filter_35_11]
MTNILGTNNSVIVDSDALIGLIHENDLLHKRCVKISDYLAQNNFVTIVCYTTVLEASTTLSRSINRPDLAKKLLQDFAQIKQPSFLEIGIAPLVAEAFDEKASKRNTPFDHYVAAVAKLNDIKLVFSFDSFYEKQGLKLLEKNTYSSQE